MGQWKACVGHLEGFLRKEIAVGQLGQEVKYLICGSK